MDVPILYSFRRCPYAMRARLALEAGEIQVELREIVLREKAPEFLEASAKGTVPVLITQSGNVIEESLDVITWALNTSPAGENLAPDRATLDIALELVRKMDADFKPHLDHYKYPNRYPDIDTRGARKTASDFIWMLDKMLAKQPFLFGQRRSVADIGIAPFIRQFANVDRDWFFNEPWGNVLAWLDEFLTSDAFLRIMNKYPKWQNGDATTLFPPAKN